MKAIIKNIKKDAFQATQEPFLEVEVAFVDETEAVLDTRKLSYPFETSEEAIKADIKKVLSAYVRDQELAEQNKEADAQAAKADEVVEALQDAEVSL